MPNSLDGTETAKNLAKAFMEESQAINIFTFYARVADNQGYPTIGKQYREVVAQQHGHAGAFYIYMAEGMSQPVINVPTDVATVQGSLSENLYFTTLYVYNSHDKYILYSQIAKNEGFESISRSFLAIAQVGQHHYLQFQDLLQRYQTDMLYKAGHEVIWECINCGYRLRALEAPRICPGCLRKREYFKIGCEAAY